MPKFNPYHCPCRRCRNFAIAFNQTPCNTCIDGTRWTGFKYDQGVELQNEELKPFRLVRE